MLALRLGLVGLPAAEASLVATVFRLHRVEASFIWTLAPEAPFDALLVDYAVDAADIARLKGRKTHLMRLGPIGSEQSDMMARPFRSDLLVRWLNSIEVDLLRSGGDTSVSTPLKSQEQVMVSQVGHGSGDEQCPPLTGHFKLRRWPTPSLLGGDVGRIRMATMLSRRPLSIKELSSTSRLSVSTCTAFVRLLEAAQLLEVRPKPSVPTAGTDVSPMGFIGAQNAQKPQAPGRGVGAALLHSIRQRFGFS